MVAAAKQELDDWLEVFMKRAMWVFASYAGQTDCAPTVDLQRRSSSRMRSVYPSIGGGKWRSWRTNRFGKSLRRQILLAFPPRGLCFLLGTLLFEHLSGMLSSMQTFYATLISAITVSVS